MKTLLFNIGFAIILILGSNACTSITERFQEELSGGGQAMIEYEVKDGDVVRIVQSFERSRYLIENTYSFAEGKLSSIRMVVYQILFDEDFSITGSKVISNVKWGASDAGLKLEEGHLDEIPISIKFDHIEESKRVRDIVLRRHRKLSRE